MPFLENVTRGRGIPRERLEAVSHHYLALGGVSPINAQNRALLDALRPELAARGIELPVYWGNRNWDPFLAPELRRIHADGHRRVLALATSAYASYSGCRQYREDLGGGAGRDGPGRRARDRQGAALLRPPGVRRAVRRGGRGRARRARGRRCPGGGDPAAVHDPLDPDGDGRGVGAARAGSAPAGRTSPSTSRRSRRSLAGVRAGGVEVPEWQLVYQSRSGSPHVPWLEPDVNDALRAAAEGGMRAAVIVPIGFVSDHVEVVWDLDHGGARDVRGARACGCCGSRRRGRTRRSSTGSWTSWRSGLAGGPVEALQPARAVARRLRGAHAARTREVALPTVAGED